MKIRNSRWEDREHLKFEANRAGHLKSEHPQARREMQHHDAEIEEALCDEIDYRPSFIPPKSRTRFYLVPEDV